MLSRERDALARQLATLCALAVLVVANGLSDGLPIHGQISESIARQFHQRFLPDDFLSALRGFVYIGLVAYGFFQMLPAQRDNPRLSAIAPAFCCAALANTAAIVSFHYESFWLSALALLACTTMLVPIYRRLQRTSREASLAELWTVQIPFRAYLGWATLAVTARFVEAIDASGADVIARHGTALVALLVVLVSAITARVGWLRRDPIYLAVVASGLFGVAVNSRSAAVDALSLLGISALSLSLVRALIVNKGHLFGPPLKPASLS